MSLDIPTIARRGVQTAWRVAASVLRPVTVRSFPSTTYNETTDTQVTTWANVTELSALLWGEKDVEDPKVSTGPETRTITRECKAMIRVEDIAIIPTTNSEIVDGANVWKVAEVAKPPGQAIILFVLQR